MSGHVLAVVGARPNFVKVAPVLRALAGQTPVRLLHTGQHYDHALSGSFLEQLGMPAPDHHLGVGSGTHAEQTAAVLVGMERVLADAPAELVLVAGDVNSTLAAALAAVKALVPVAHLEAGLRSRDWTMPEEINRVVTDRVSDLLLCTSADAVDNLRAEGVARERIVLTGNTMIDSLLRLLPQARERDPAGRLGLDGPYVLVTLHRPGLVDDPARLTDVLAALCDVARRLPVVLPLHPRTRARLDQMGWPAPRGMRLLQPLDYLDFIALEDGASVVVTDSGGIQEETSVLGVPCLTYRTTTERPVTVELGTNRLLGVEHEALAAAVDDALAAGRPPVPPEIPLWDGHAGERCAEAILRFLSGRPRLEDPHAAAADDEPVALKLGDVLGAEQRPAGDLPRR
jgi:UDP-N-acetylglucosamine 2-epimerase (non-hydrolysing)